MEYGVPCRNNQTEWFGKENEMFDFLGFSLLFTYLSFFQSLIGKLIDLFGIFIQGLLT